jgi:plastocyanin
MARLASIFVLLVFLNLSAATHDVQVGPNFSFVPQALIINSGDSVRWTNVGGFHNVLEISSPPVFSSGDPSNAPWVFIHEFNEQFATVYAYICEVHVEQGMVGAITVMPPSGVGDQPVPQEFSVSDAYPNPFNALSHIDLSLPNSSSVKVEVYNSLGQLTATVFDGFAVAGTHRFAIDGANWASGLYFVRVSALDQTAFKKLVLLK